MDKNSNDKASRPLSEIFEGYLVKLSNAVGHEVTQEELAQMAQILAKPYAKNKEFKCTLHAPCISWFKGGQRNRNLGDPNKPRNLLWITVVFMYWYVLPDESWLLIWLKNECPKQTITDDGIEWILTNAPLILDEMKIPWPKQFRHVSDATTEGNLPVADLKSKPKAKLLHKNELIPLAEGEREANTDSLHLPLEDLDEQLQRLPKPLPRTTRTRIIAAATKIINTVAGFE